MLTGDRSKYLAIVFAVTFACFLIAEQSATFCGVRLRMVREKKVLVGQLLDVFIDTRP
jgi:hypothetical protein